LLNRPLRARRYEKQQAEDELSKLEDDQRLKALDAEREQHRPKDPMAELETALES